MTQSGPLTDTERQVAERLLAYGKELPVTDHDVRAAREELWSRLDDLDHDAHSPTRPWAFAVAAAVAVVALVAGAVALRGGDDESAPNLPATEALAPEIRAPEGAAPTVELLAGIWREESESSLLVRFGADGTYAIDNAASLDEPWQYGTYRLDGQKTEFSAVGGHAGRCSWAWLAGLPEDGRLETVAIQSPATGDCVQAEGEGEEGRVFVFTRVSPPSPASGAMVGDETEATELTIADQVKSGIWLQQESGRLLDLGVGSYAVADDGQLGAAPDDGGNLVVTEPGVLTLTSAQGSKDCAAGDSTTLQQVRITPTSLLLGTSVSTCQGQADLSGSWVLLAGDGKPTE